MENGWIKLHRELLKKAIWKTSTAEQRAILITILLLANHEENQWQWQGKKFICIPGQFITSSINLAQKSGVSRQSVRTALKKFEKYEFLTYESTKTGMLITVMNWGKYQADARTVNQEVNQDLTNDQPTPNQDLTTNKNDKKDKNDKNIYTPEFESWYSEYPRKQAREDSAKNFAKRRKEHGLDFILQCSENYLAYLKTLPPDKQEYTYASNNFFGQKAYYLEYAEPKEEAKRNILQELFGDCEVR